MCLPQTSQERILEKILINHENLKIFATFNKKYHVTLTS